MRLLLLSLLFPFLGSAQILINEGSNRNVSQVLDEDGDANDWLELYNVGNQAVNLQGYHLSDDAGDLGKWTFPNIAVGPQGHLLIFASGKNRLPLIDHWETAVDLNSTWDYLVPVAQPDPAWGTPAYAPVGWQSGTAGIGYGDGDDATVVPVNTISVYMRTSFFVADTSAILSAILNIDYDDGYVAYLNGFELTRAGLSGTPPTWNELAAPDHEAVMYQGQNPEGNFIDPVYLHQILLPGINVLSVEVHNSAANSSDLSIVPFLHFSLNNAVNQFGPNPPWFIMGAGQNALHANFKLSAGGEMVFLSDPSMTLLDTLMVESVMPNYSIGRATDGAATLSYFSPGTPAAANGGPTFTGFAPKPVFVTQPGEYGGPTTIEFLPPPAGTVIRYSLTGQTPTATSPLYTNPFTINSTKAVKARCFSINPGILPGVPATGTFLINENHTVPVISITVDSIDFYGVNGIYDNYWTDWKKASNVEWIGADGIEQFNTRASLKIDGGNGGSRSNPQRSMRLEPGHGVLGDGSLTNFEMFPDRPSRTTFETFYLRNGSQQWRRQTYKDGWLTRMQKNLDNAYMAYRAAAVYINGGFFGIYELREKMDTDFFKQNYGTNTDSLDILSMTWWYGGVLRVVEGSDVAWWQLMGDVLAANANDASFYGMVDQRLNLHAFADYMLSNNWLCNFDWPFNNVRIWRAPNVDNHRWKFCQQDHDASIGYGYWGIDQNFNGYSHMQNYDPNNFVANLWRKVHLNPEFRRYFINRYADVMNTEYIPSRIQPMATEFFDEFAPELPRNFARWGGYATLADYQTFMSDAQSITKTQMMARNAVARNQTQAWFGMTGQVDVTLDVDPPGAGVIRINTIQPGPYPWTGVYFNGNPITVTAVANPGYEFSYWDPNQFIQNISNPGFTVNVNLATTFTAHFDTTSVPQLAISEINYNTATGADDGEWIELLNYGIVPVNLGGWFISDPDSINRFVFPNGLLLMPGARLVLVAEPNKFTALHPNVSNYLGPFAFSLNNAGETLKLYSPSGQLYSTTTYDDTAPWPTAPDGGGRTLERLAPAGPNSDASNWFAGCMGGSPGEPYTPCNEAIVFNEVNYNADAIQPTDDWVELRNTSGAAIDLSNWKFKDSNNASIYTIPAGTVIQPDSLLVLYQNTIPFQTFHPTVANAIGPFLFGLSSTGERIRLYDNADRLQYSLDYEETAPWPTSPNGQGYTLELLNPNSNVNDGNSWIEGCYGGSPGEYLQLPCFVDAQQTTPALSWECSVFPNPVDETTQLRLVTPEAAQVRLRLLDHLGREVSSTVTRQAISGAQTMPLNTAALAKGTYFLEVSLGGERQVLKLVRE